MLAMSGCATVNPKPALDAKGYEVISKARAETTSCFNAGYISPKLYADSELAFDEVLNSRAFDRERLHQMTLNYFSISQANSSVCRKTESEIYQLIAHTGINNQQTNIRVQQSEPQFPTYRAPIFCNKIGMMTMCN